MPGGGSISVTWLLLHCHNLCVYIHMYKKNVERRPTNDILQYWNICVDLAWMYRWVWARTVHLTICCYVGGNCLRYKKPPRGFKYDINSKLTHLILSCVGEKLYNPISPPFPYIWRKHLISKPGQMRHYCIRNLHMEI
jgi:hypothetical protein